MPLPLTPDPADLLIRALLAQPTIAALVGTRVYDRVAGTVWPMLVVGTVSETPDVEPRVTSALMQVDCWGRGGGPSDVAEARLLARTVRAACPDLRGPRPPAAGSIAVAAFDLLLPQPDTTTGRARFVVQISLTITTTEEQ